MNSISPQLFNFLMLVTVVIAVLAVVYLLVKKAVKDALREYDEEKRSHTDT